MSAVRPQSVPAAAASRRTTPTALLLAWAPVVVWMVCIVSLSSDRFSDENTAAWLLGIIGPLGVSPAVIEVGNLIVRKCAHFVEYAILGLLTWRALRATWPQRRRRQLLLAAMAIAAAWAGLDELRQYLTTTARGGKAQDVVLDAAGGLAGVAFGAAYLERRGHRRT